MAYDLLEAQPVRGVLFLLTREDDWFNLSYLLFRIISPSERLPHETLRAGASVYFFCRIFHD